MNRPEFIKSYQEIEEPPRAYYSESDETFARGAPFSKAFGLSKIGIHHQTLAPGTRTSWPHAEGDEEEFVFVIEGAPDAWIDGHLYRLSPGDAVGFPSGTGIAHTFINNTTEDVRLLVVGEPSQPDGRVFYPMNPSRKEPLGSRWWSDVPKRNLGEHDGRPNKKY